MKIINKTDLKDFKDNFLQYYNVRYCDNGCWLIGNIQFNHQNWQLRFISVNEWKLFHIQENFNIYFLMSGNNIEIGKVVKNGRTYKSDKYLKKYTDLILMVNTLFLLNKIKIEEIIE